jgi:hypothetical protein
MVVKAVTAVVGNAAIAKSHGILAHRRQRPAVVIPYTTSTYPHAALALNSSRTTAPWLWRISRCGTDSWSFVVP